MHVALGARLRGNHNDACTRHLTVQGSGAGRHYTRKLINEALMHIIREWKMLR